MKTATKRQIRVGDSAMLVGSYGPQFFRVSDVQQLAAGKVGLVPLGAMRDPESHLVDVARLDAVWRNELVEVDA